jgi:import inner membrane translocase subunit TIM22
MTSLFPGQVPYAAGKEPVPAGFTPEDVENVRQAKKMEMFMSEAMTSCPAKTVMAGGAGTLVPRMLCIDVDPFSELIP